MTNNLNQYTQVDNISQKYDKNGNLIEDGDLKLTYNSLNRPIFAQKGKNKVKFYYDPFNRQIAREINGKKTYFIYDKWSVAEEFSANKNISYVTSDKIDEILVKEIGNEKYFYHRDHLGSTTALTDEKGKVVAKFVYDSFGKHKNLTGNDNSTGHRYLFTGREYIKEVDLYDYRNRLYTTNTGRFMQTDPIKFEAKDMNIYRYVGNNPVNKIDHFGLIEVTLFCYNGTWEAIDNKYLYTVPCGSCNAAGLLNNFLGFVTGDGTWVKNVYETTYAKYRHCLVCSSSGINERKTLIATKKERTFDIGYEPGY